MFMPKKIGLLDGRLFAQVTTDAFTFVDTGGAAYPQQHGAKKKPKDKGVGEVIETTEPAKQLWERYEQDARRVVKELMKHTKCEESVRWKTLEDGRRVKVKDYGNFNVKGEA